MRYTFGCFCNLHVPGEVFFPQTRSVPRHQKRKLIGLWRVVCGDGSITRSSPSSLCNGLFGFSWIAAVRPQCFLEHSKVPLAAAQHFPWWSSSLGVFATCANRAGQLPRTLPRSARARSHLPRTSRALSMSQVFSRPNG